jgi:hypothetical protein
MAGFDGGLWERWANDVMLPGGGFCSNIELLDIDTGDDDDAAADWMACRALEEDTDLWDG